MYLSPAQKKAQGLLLDELKKFLASVTEIYKKSIYPDVFEEKNEGGREAIEWLEEWVEEKTKEIA